MRLDAYFRFSFSRTSWKGKSMHGLNVLVYGRSAGARETALVRLAAASLAVGRVFCFAGNAEIQTSGRIEVHHAPANDDALLTFCWRHKIDLVIIGPEALLAEGKADFLRQNGFWVFGPNREAAKLETSKAWAVEFARRFRIPVAETTIHNSASEALAQLVARETWPVVVKYDGLAGGKGVTICHSRDEANRMLLSIYEREPGARVLLQEYLQEHPDFPRAEFSVHVLVAEDQSYKILPVCQDYKTKCEEDKGPMTGGLGCFSPVPGLELDGRFMRVVEEKIIVPTLNGLRALSLRYQGVIYFGLKMTPEGPYIIEYNCRFGDPEVVALIELMRSDLIPVLHKVASGLSIADAEIEYYDDSVVVLVVANENYPDEGSTVVVPPELLVETTYHAGTKLRNGAIVSDGGRIVCLTACRRTISEARAAVYAQVPKESMPGLQARGDVAKWAADAELANER